MTRRLLLAAVALVLLAATLVAAPPTVAVASSHTIYVAPDGRDSNPGTIARPKATMQSAMRALPDGGTILLRGGRYTIRNNSGILWQGGTAKRPLVVKSAPGERARLTSAAGNHCVVAAADYIQIRNLDCTGFMGIGAFNSSQIVIAGNYVHDLSADRTQGIVVSGNRSDFRDIRVVRNRVVRVPHSGIVVGDLRRDAVTNVVIKKNTVRQANYQFRNAPTWGGGWGSGIAVVGAKNARVVRNDVRRTYGEAFNCALSTGCRVRRNVAVDAYNVLFYGDNAVNSIWEDNVAKTTGDKRFLREQGFGPIEAQGYVLANETGWYAGPGRPARGNIIRNNVAINVNIGFRFAEYQNGAAGMRDTVVANNTFVGVTNCGIRLYAPAANSGNSVVNNLVVPTAGGRAFCGGDRGTTMGNNLWARGRVEGGLSAGDIRAMPDFTRGRGLRPSSYRLKAGSPGVNDGRVVRVVTDDRRGVDRPRGGRFDIGAFER